MPASASVGVVGQVPKATVKLDGKDGSILLLNDGKPWIRIGSGANVWLGGKGEHGHLMLFHENENDTSDYTKATVWLSGHKIPDNLVLRGAQRAQVWSHSRAGRGVRGRRPGR